MSTTRLFPVVLLGAAMGAVWLVFSGVFVAPCRAQSVLITDTRDTTQNLDVLYPGSGDRSALLTASAVVDVPGGDGDGLYSATVAPWTITNVGVVRGDNGVYLGLGGSVTNLNEITGRDLNGIGIYMATTGGTSAVTNGSSGTITGGSSFAIGGIGIDMQNSLPTSTVDNFGQIYAYGDGVSSRGTAVLLNGGGTLTNQADAAIIGGYGDTTGVGAYLYGPGTVNNSGQITGNNGQGVIIIGTGTVNNTGNGTITGNGATIGVWISGGTGTVTNEEAATITGGRNGVVISGSGSVTNDGTIVGQDDGYYGVRFSNTTAGIYATAVTNGGSISGGAAGVSVRFVPATGTVAATNVINNTGTIAATGIDGAGLWIQGAEGAFTNTISNEGTISGVYGVLLEPDTASFTSTITNSGTIEGTTEAGLDITGVADVVNSGTITGSTGIVFDDTTSDSLSNTGTIIGTDGTAVDMGGGDDAVELGSGSTITGMIRGGDGTDTLTLVGSGAIGIDRVTAFEGLFKEGTGTWTLMGTGSSGGAIAINGGTLAVNGTVGDNVTVASPATLMGSGTVGSVTNGGHIAPGNSIGTLTVNGNYTHAADAVYEVEVNADGESDLIDVTGSATINGGTVSVLAEEGDYSLSTDYVILHAEGGVTGTFDYVTSNLAFLDPTLGYLLYDVTLTLDRNQTSFLDIARTYNQRAVAEVVDDASLTASGDAQTVIDALLPLTAEEARLGFDQMGGAVYTAFPMVDVDRTYRYMRTLFHGSGAGRLGQGSTVGPGATRQNFGPWGLWIDGQGTYGERDGDDIASRFDYRVGSAAFGADYAFSETFRGGLSVGYADTQIDYDDLRDEGEVDSYQVALYGVHESGPTYFEGALFYGSNDYEMTRQIDFGSLEREAQGDYSGYELAGYFEAGYKLLTQGMEIRPMASIFALSHHQDSFSETGADAINIEADSQDYWSLKSTLGVGIAKQFGRPDHFTWRPQALVGWVHEFGDDRYEMDARYADVPADEYNVCSDSVDRDSALLGVGVTAQMGQRTQLMLFYDALVRSSYTEHALTAGLGYVW